jgi:outer membrane protein assembly factor BamB/tetratricopeptide (TPR) repeat protein
MYMIKLKILLIPVLIFIQAILIAQTPGTKKWEFSTGSDVSSSPAIAGDGTIYVGSNDYKLYAINSDGTKKWEFETGGSIFSSPAVGADGTIYVGSNDNKLYSINPNGTKKWEFLTGNLITSSPAIGFDGTIYVGSQDNAVYAINPDGSKKWEFVTGNSIYSSPSIGIDGTIYVGSADHNLYAINPNGTKKWEFSTGNSIDNSVSSSPAIGIDGTIYVCSNNNNVYAINPNGTKKWEFTTGSSVFSSPAIGVDGTIFVGSGDNSVYAMNPDGTKKWMFTTSNMVSSSPVIGIDGSIFIGSDDNKLYALNPDGSKKWEFSTDDYINSSPAIGIDGTIYFGSQDNMLYAIYSDCGGLARSCWPKFRNNNENTGKNKISAISSIRDFYALLSNKTALSFEIIFNKTTGMPLTINQINIYNEYFNVDLSLPYEVNAEKSNFIIPVTITNSKTELYKAVYDITYQYNNDEPVNYSNSLEVAVIVDDHSEQGVVGKQAIEAFQSSLDSNLIALTNNRGVIYRLLGEYEKAEDYFNSAVSMALEQNYGFTGIKMNQGVVMSDKRNDSGAMDFYSNSLADLSGEEASSVIAPQLYYNQAWEYYRSKTFEDSREKALATIQHNNTNDFLKAKAYVLLGADLAALGDTLAAIDNFYDAIHVDSTSCIADIARENIRLLNNLPTDVENLQSHTFVIYPNPNKGDFEILTANDPGNPVNIEIQNMTGTIIYNNIIYNTGKTYKIHLENIRHGLYIITIKSGGKEIIEKMMIY